MRGLKLQYIPTSQIRLESKEKAVNGHFKSTVELFKSKVESWIGAPWDWWPLGPIKRRLGVKEDRVYWRCICGEERWAEIPLDFVMPLLSAMNNFPQSSQPSQSSSNTGSAGVWRYSHCDFYLCEKFGDSEFVPKTRDKFPGTSDEADYYFVPREMEDRMPPVTPHEFNRRFYRRFHACRCVTPRPRLFMFHRCRRQSGGHSRDVLDLFPKKRTKLEEGGNGRRLFWGIYAREAIALRWVLGYNFVCTLPMLVFFFVWVLRLGPDEIQNASVPVSVMLAMLSLFWSVFFSSLPFGRSQ
ncbi:hypothetical protein LY76DRAFT_639153 [Colletotrichum caudatum]|nr:hypothetical protein LY76DRAFT_639153 [Colletotrichum caudatum]